MEYSEQNNTMDAQGRWGYPPGYKPVQLAEAYIPYQRYVNSFLPEESLLKGTMFPELYKPYVKKHM